MAEEIVYAKAKKGSGEILKMTKEYYDKYKDDLTEVKDGANAYAKQSQKQSVLEVSNKMAGGAETNKADA